MSHNYIVLIPVAHCTKNKVQLETLCRQSVKCTPISETSPVLHQYSAKWVRNITQDMNFNMTLIEPSIQVFIWNTPSSCTSFCNSLCYESVMGQLNSINTKSLYLVCSTYKITLSLAFFFLQPLLIMSDLKYQCLFMRKQSHSSNPQDELLLTG